MKKFLLKFSAILLFILIFLNYTSGQTVIDFETANDGYTPSTTSGSGSTDVFNRSNPDIGGNSTYIWACEDLSLTDPSITLDQIDITGSTSFTFSIDMLTPNTEDWDVVDELLITYSIDGGAYQNLMWVQSNEDGDNYNAPAALDLAFDGTGDDGEELPALVDDFGAGVGSDFETFSTSSIAISGNTTLDIKLQYNGLTSAGEGIYIDNITITQVGGSTNDDDSYASAPGTQVSGGNISSINNDEVTEDMNVFRFDIDDTGDSDSEPTHVTNIRIKPGASNTADWTDNIQGVILNDGTSDITTGSVTITDTYIDIPITSGDLDIADGGTETITMSIYLNTSNIEDGETLSFLIDYDDHGFSADASGSTFASSFGSADIESNDFTIVVVATELNFAQQPTNTGVSVCMSPDVSVEATDANGNRDVDFTSDIRITSTGSLVGSPIDVTAVSGLATFSGGDCITHDATGNNLTLNAERTSTTDWDVTSDEFDITESCATDLIISEYVEGSSNNKYLEIYNNTGSDVDLGDYDIRIYANGSSSVTSTINLSGTLSNQDVYVIAHSSASEWSGTPDLSTGSLSFNGNDAVALYDGTSNIDVMGTIGSSATWAENTTLVRNDDITSPNSTYTTSEWTEYSEDDVSHLGSHTMTCSCEEPTTHSSSLSFSSIGTTSMDLSWTSGNGNNRIVVCRQGDAVSFTPTDGSTYSANSDYSAAAEVGTAGEGNKVVYNNNGSSFTVTGLTPGRTYYFKIYEYNCSPGSEDYLTSGSPLEGNETTNLAPVTDLDVTCVTNTTATVQWTAPAGNFTGVVIGFRNSSNACHVLSGNASDLTANTVFSSGTQYGTTSPYSYVVYKGSGTSVTVTGLTEGNEYQIKAYTYLNETGTTWGNTNPTTSISSAEVENVSNASTFASNQTVDVHWTNPAGCYDEIMVVAHQAGSVTSTPSGDGSSYTANSAFGSGTNMGSDDYVVYKGVGTSVDVTSLTNETQYCFKIFTRKGSQWSSGVEICATPVDITVFLPGDLIFVGYDTKTSDNGCGGAVATDVFYIMTMVDIKPGTSFGLLNASYESGASANVRTDKFWSCTSTPGSYHPGRIEITWNGSSNIASGSIIEVFLTPTNAASYFEVNGTNETSNFSSTGEYTNMAESSPDQMWIYQGAINNYGSASPNYYCTIDGNILFGLSNQAAWIPFSSAVSTARTSRIHPDIECFNMDFSGDVPVNYYIITASHSGSKRSILNSIMNSSNWQTASNTVCNDVPSGVGTTTFSISGGYSAGTWRGDTDDDWFNCSNWESLAVPDSTIDVTVATATTTNSPDIDNNSSNADKFDNIAKCKDLDIDGETLYINGDNADTLKILGDLTIQNSATLDMDDGTAASDGIIYIWGNWNNQASFDEGDGSVVFMGDNAQSITASSGTENFNNLTLYNIYLDGVTANSNIIVENKFSQNNNTLDLNGNNLTISGEYSANSSFFIGDASSNLTFNGSGTIDSIYFKTDFNLNNFTINRNAETANLMTDLFVSNNFTITDGQVILSAGNDYSAGTLINTPADSDALIIKSNPAGTASLLQTNGEVEATCERYLPKDQWHYVFSPLDDVDRTDLSQVSWGPENPNFYFYDETIADFWDGATVYNPTGWTNETNAKLSVDKGYIHQSTENKVYELDGGNLKASDKSFTLNYTDNGTGNEPNTGTDWDEFEGWNLIGNPYACAIDWDDVWTEISNNGQDSYLENGVYYFDPSQSKYVYYGSASMNNLGITVNGSSNSDNAYIPANQAFFVKAKPAGDGNSITIPKSARTHSDQGFWKNSDKNNIPNLIRLNIEKNGYTDETIIRTHKNATDNRDFDLDAYKMFSWDGFKPQIFTTNSEFSKNYSINSLAPLKNEHKIIPLAIYIGYEGEYNINLTENTFTDTHIWLEDIKNNLTLNILDSAKYTFCENQGIINNRFKLHLNKNHPPHNQQQIPDQTIYVFDNWNFTINKNTFVDNDFGDELKISATLTNGNELPAWLKFDENTFYGIPQNTGKFSIRVFATDKFGEQSFSDFNLTVIENNTAINAFAENINIFPNPANDIININMPYITQKTKIKLFSINGILVKEIKAKKENMQIDISNFARGSYFVEISNENSCFRNLLILK